MILAIDIGNTNIVIGVIDGNQIIASWRISTDKQKTADEYGIVLRSLFQHSDILFKDITAIVVASVVPTLSMAIEEMGNKFFSIRTITVDSNTKTGMPILMDNPDEVGADRIVNGIAAYKEYGGPLIVVDLGTATTFDVISKNGEYIGGAIAPGVGISMEALFSRAAKLPKVAFEKPPFAIAKNTIHCMQSGFIYGFVGQVEGIIKKIKEELGDCLVIATGGLAEVVAKESTLIDKVDQFLTLYGLKIIYEQNK